MPLWNLLVTMPSARVTSSVFLWDLSFKDKKHTWSNHIFSIFRELNLINIFDNLVPCSINHCYKMILDNEATEWNSSRYSKPKLRLYNMFKSDLVQEPYINMNVSKYKRSLFAQLRAGILPLHIETGRFVDTNLNDRVCQICGNGEIEDEIHFITSCSAYNDLRDTLYTQAADNNPEFKDYDMLDSFVYLMNNMQKPTMHFVCNAYHRRRAIIYQN